MRLRCVLLAGLMLTLATGAAFAQPVSGLYVGAGAGVNFREPSSSSNSKTRISTNPGPVGVAALGWGFGNGLRAEVEGSYRNNSVHRLQTLRTNGLLEDTANVTGRIETAAAMTNLLYDFDLSRFGVPAAPYVGGGLGYGWQDDNVTGASRSS